MEKVTNRILWSVLLLALGVSLYIFGKPAFSDLAHGSIQQLSHLTKQWDVAAPADEDLVDASSNSDFYYSDPNTSDHTISINRYVGHKENLTIPQYRKVGSIYYKVTAISDNAFDENKSIKQVTIPDGVTSIGNWAFAGTQLTSVDLPAGLTSIGDYAFYNTQLTKVHLPASLTSIGDGTFRDTPLTGVDLPSGLVSIGACAFYGTKLTSVDFPASLTSIGDYAFYGTQLTSVDFPAGLTSIGDAAFNGTPISAISFKHRVDLGKFSFTQTNLTNVTLLTGSTYNVDINSPTFDRNVKVTFN